MLTHAHIHNSSERLSTNLKITHTLAVLSLSLSKSRRTRAAPESRENIGARVCVRARRPRTHSDILRYFGRVHRIRLWFARPWHQARGPAIVYALPGQRTVGEQYRNQDAGRLASTWIRLKGRSEIVVRWQPLRRCSYTIISRGRDVRCMCECDRVIVLTWFRLFLKYLQYLQINIVTEIYITTQ